MNQNVLQHILSYHSFWRSINLFTYLSWSKTPEIDRVFWCCLGQGCWLNWDSPRLSLIKGCTQKMRIDLKMPTDWTTLTAKMCDALGTLKFQRDMFANNILLCSKTQSHRLSSITCFPLLQFSCASNDPAGLGWRYCLLSSASASVSCIACADLVFLVRCTWPATHSWGKVAVGGVRSGHFWVFQLRLDEPL